jgi:hypothetical protein
VSLRSKDGWRGMKVKKLLELEVRDRISPRQLPQNDTE